MVTCVCFEFFGMSSILDVHYLDSGRWCACYAALARALGPKAVGVCEPCLSRRFEGCYSPLSCLPTNSVSARPQRFARANAQPGPADLIVLKSLTNRKPRTKSVESVHHHFLEGLYDAPGSIPSLPGISTEYLQHSKTPVVLRLTIKNRR